MKYLLIVLIAFVLSSLAIGNDKRWNIDKIKTDLSEEGIVYFSDTLIDVNNDGFEDLIVKGLISANYPFNPQVVCLNGLPDSLYFSFFNPTFSLNDKIVRCVYGDFSDGYLFLEKYRWETDSKIDTIDYYIILADYNTDSLPFLWGRKILDKSEIPEEYFSITRFDYFYKGIILNSWE